MAPAMAHGGMLSAASLLFPDAPRPWLDLSTGINPVAYPVGPFAPDDLARLPDAADEARLREVAARLYGVADPGMVVATPGTQVAIGLLPYLVGGGRDVAVLGPTYGEHAASWGAAGHRVQEVAAFDSLARAGIAVLCQPNNPDGRIYPPEVIRVLADRMAHQGGMLVVDEAFADFEEGASVAGFLPHPALVVLRSFGKSYGLAGLRLGFVLAEPRLAARIRMAFGPWAVSGPALAVGLRALSDSVWRCRAKARLSADAARLDALIGRKLIGGTHLFRLYGGEGMNALYRRLGERGILVRRFGAQPDRLRFGLPGDEAAWSRLAAALA